MDLIEQTKQGGIVATCVAATAYLFSKFATNSRVEKIEKTLETHVYQYNKDRLVQQQIYDVFVNKGLIK